MAKLLTLRNILTLLAIFFFASCSNSHIAEGELKSISSEDNYTTVIPVGIVADPESGEAIYVVARK